MTDSLDLSPLAEISEDREEKLSPSWKRILRALRKLREDQDGGRP